jgi:hypothetical protein
LGNFPREIAGYPCNVSAGLHSSNVATICA